jgi:hypothetical protein
LTMIDILEKRIDIRATSNRVDKLGGLRALLECWKRLDYLPYRR